MDFMLLIIKKKEIVNKYVTKGNFVLLSAYD